MKTVNGFLVLLLVICGACGSAPSTQLAETDSFVSPPKPEPLLSPVDPTPEGSAFIGFRTPSKPGFNDISGCDLFRHTAYCEPIKPNVVMAISFPESRSLCDPYVDTVHHPIVQIGVSLAVERKVQGMLFTTHFMSVKLEDQLFEPLGGVILDPAVCSDEAALKEFDEAALRVAQAVIEGRVDEETAYQLELVKEFANSIQVPSLDALEPDVP